MVFDSKSLDQSDQYVFADVHFHQILSVTLTFEPLSSKMSLVSSGLVNE